MATTIDATTMMKMVVILIKKTLFTIAHYSIKVLYYLVT